MPTILGKLKRYFRDLGWAVHVPRGHRYELVDETVTTSVAARQLSVRQDLKPGGWDDPTRPVLRKRSPGGVSAPPRRRTVLPQLLPGSYVSQTDQGDRWCRSHPPTPVRKEVTHGSTQASPHDTRRDRSPRRRRRRDRERRDLDEHREQHNVGCSEYGKLRDDQHHAESSSRYGQLPQLPKHVGPREAPPSPRAPNDATRPSPAGSRAACIG